LDICRPIGAGRVTGLTDIQPASPEDFPDLAFNPPSASHAQIHLNIDSDF
jgi:hypothetical protein